MRKSTPINIRRLDHVVLRVVDLQRMLDFYCDVLGCRLERGPGDIGLAQLRAGDSLIDLLDVGGPLGREGDRSHPQRANLDHLCLQVHPWDEPAILSHLRAHGVACGEVAQRYGATGKGASFYLEDPEGNRVELTAGSP